MGNRHVTDGSLDFGQRKDVFHQLCHFGACEIFDLRGKALNRSAQIAKLKTLEHLRAEKERAETQLAQEQHKLERLENRKKYLEKGERTTRTHRLCNLGGTIESLAPEVKDLTRTEKIGRAHV